MSKQLESPEANGFTNSLGRLLTSNLMAAMLLVSLLPLLVLCFSVYHYASQTTHEQATNKLSTLRKLKANQLEQYFQTIHNQVHTFSSDLMVIEATKAFSEDFAKARAEGQGDLESEQIQERLKTFYESEFARQYQEKNNRAPNVQQLLGSLDEDAIYHQFQYLAENTHALGQKESLDMADDGSAYSKTHAKYHSTIRDFRKTFGYYDIFLIDHRTGDIVYSVAKELDFATSLEDGPYADSNFARAYKKAKAANWKDMVAFVDYEHYEPSLASPASFIAAPVFDGREKVGVVVFQMPVDLIDSIVNEGSEPNSQTESYVVGPDSLIRNNLDDLEGGMLSIRIETGPEHAATSAEQVFEIVNRNGKPALASASPIVVHPSSGFGDPEETWTLLTQTPLSEIHAPTHKIFWFAFTTFVVAGLLVTFMSLLISKRFTMQSKRQDQLVDAISENMMAMASASEQLTSVSQQMSAAAEQTTAQVRVVSQASDHVSENTQNVSKGVENFSISINEVAASASNAAHVANHAVDVAQTADVSIKKLGESSKHIDDIVKVITSIAEQTNLLALNATIEAARAGEAGKGFAVVAGEVKELAKETSKATENIRNSIEEIRDDTDKAVDAISDITG
ncbi:MAG: methyl-accepting chemotaxis protein, partial [Rubripirellula sp.]